MYRCSEGDRQHGCDRPRQPPRHLQAGLGRFLMLCYCRTPDAGHNEHRTPMTTTRSARAESIHTLVRNQQDTEAGTSVQRRTDVCLVWADEPLEYAGCVQASAISITRILSIWLVFTRFAVSVCPPRLQRSRTLYAINIYTAEVDRTGQLLRSRCPRFCLGILT